MKNILVSRITVALITFGLIITVSVNGQNKRDCLKKYLDRLPTDLKLIEKIPQKYIMTAEYFNKDIYGEFQSKVKVTGEYTRGLDNGYVRWNNVFIAYSKSCSESYPQGVNQDYMESMEYVPSPQMLEESSFENFPDNTENIFARNLIWDMMAVEGFTWDHFDSLRLNKTYIIPDIHGRFNIANIGTYNHKNIQLCWLGISMMNNELCGIIEYRALDNRLEFNTNDIKSKGSELYWGKTWVSLENKQIEYAEMHSNTIQEMEIQGLSDKLLVNTTRILRVDKIQ